MSLPYKTIILINSSGNSNRIFVYFMNPEIKLKIRLPLLFITFLRKFLKRNDNHLTASARMMGWFNENSKYFFFRVIWESVTQQMARGV